MSRGKTDKEIFQFYLSEISQEKKKRDDISARFFSANFDLLSPSEQLKLQNEFDLQVSSYDALCRVFSQFAVKHADKIKFE